MKKNYFLLALLGIGLIGAFMFTNHSNQSSAKEISVKKATESTLDSKKNTQAKDVDAKIEKRARFAEERLLHEFNLQKNPTTGKIPKSDKLAELQKAFQLKEVALSTKAKQNIDYSYISRGPTNVGGRTRTLVIDKADATGNTMLAGAVSGGVFRTTDGGASWVKTSPFDDIHNVTAIAQDPRAGNQNVWYYATGENIGNSASLPFNNLFLGRGIWRSTDGGLTWSQLNMTDSNQTVFDDVFDLISSIQVHPITGDLFIGTIGGIYRYDGANIFAELIITSGISSGLHSDVKITSDGTVYAGLFLNNSTRDGVWRLNNGQTGTANWTRIASNGTPTGWFAPGRIVLGTAPSNSNIVYALYNNGDRQSNANGNIIEADLWRWNQSNQTWVNFSSRLPDEDGNSQDLIGNDPFAIQGGYDLVVSVKPDDQNFVVIGGTNVYKIENIVVDPQFERIGGYISNLSYGLYDTAGGDRHHPDIHALVFSESNSNIMFTGTDGGVHRTDNILATTVDWTNLNNNYQTYQFYHVALNNSVTIAANADIVIGGAQDNGTVASGLNFNGSLTETSPVFGGDGAAVAISNDDACLPFFFSAQLGFLRRDCPTPATITPNNSQSQFVTYFHLDPDNTNALYYAGSNRLYRTTQSTTVTSSTWTNLGLVTSIPGTPSTPNQNLTWFETSRGAYNPATSFMLIGGSEGNVFKLNDPQATNTTLANATNITPPGVVSGSYVSSITIHPSNPDTAIVTISSYGVQNIFISDNITSATPSWTLVERNLSDFSIRSSAIAEFSGETKYFVGTARGLYSSPDPRTTDWTLEAPNQIGFAIISGLRYRAADSRILIGTHGNGMWQADATGTFSVADNNASAQFKVYPNPIENNQFSVQSEIFKNNDSQVAIYNLAGKKIYETGMKSSANGNITVQPTVDLSSGIYILTVKQQKKNYSTQIIVK